MSANSSGNFSVTKAQIHLAHDVSKPSSLSSFDISTSKSTPSTRSTMKWAVVIFTIIALFGLFNLVDAKSSQSIQTLTKNQFITVDTSEYYWYDWVDINDDSLCTLSENQPCDGTMTRPTDYHCQDNVGNEADVDKCTGIEKPTDTTFTCAEPGTCTYNWSDDIGTENDCTPNPPCDTRATRLTVHVCKDNVGDDADGMCDDAEKPVQTVDCETPPIPCTYTWGGEIGSTDACSLPYGAPCNAYTVRRPAYKCTKDETLESVAESFCPQASRPKLTVQCATRGTCTHQWVDVGTEEDCTFTDSNPILCDQASTRLSKYVCRDADSLTVDDDICLGLHLQKPPTSTVQCETKGPCQHTWIDTSTEDDCSIPEDGSCGSSSVRSTKFKCYSEKTKQIVNDEDCTPNAKPESTIITCLNPSICTHVWAEGSTESDCTLPQDAQKCDDFRTRLERHRCFNQANEPVDDGWCDSLTKPEDVEMITCTSRGLCTGTWTDSGTDADCAFPAGAVCDLYQTRDPKYRCQSDETGEFVDDELCLKDKAKPTPEPIKCTTIGLCTYVWDDIGTEDDCSVPNNATCGLLTTRMEQYRCLKEEKGEYVDPDNCLATAAEPEAKLLQCTSRFTCTYSWTDIGTEDDCTLPANATCDAYYTRPTNYVCQAAENNEIGSDTLCDITTKPTESTVTCSHRDECRDLNNTYHVSVILSVMVVIMTIFVLF